MGRLKKKGEAGAAKAYTTRTAAVKKLQCSLADFRRLCILKGIYPREPRNKKRANKGSTAPTSFYYTKDIAYLAHEPVLKKLREHKSFAKKLSRALGRGEWSIAKRLDDNKPVYRLDHIIKERYPTFVDAVRDIDDALCMIFLFASLPSHTRIPPSLIANCTRLSAEWQLYVMHSRLLRKAFLSIKGVYFQADLMDQTVTWLVPYQFTQTIPPDVDVRIMLTFLEFYQAFLGFVLFRLYSDAGLLYPPPWDANKDENAAGVGAYTLPKATQNTINLRAPGVTTMNMGNAGVSSKDVRQTIKTIATEPQENDIDMPDADAVIPPNSEEDSSIQHTSSDPQTIDSFPTLTSTSDLPLPPSTALFSPFVFFLSRETSRPIFEFVVRSFGGLIGWPPSLGSDSPFDESDPSITHVIIDRPISSNNHETIQEREGSLRRKWIQPQWVIDCVNAGKILPEEEYEQGKSLPPHLSPFEDYHPRLTPEDGESAESDDEYTAHPEVQEGALAFAAAAAADVNDPGALRAAGIVAEAAGVGFGTFEKTVEKTRRAVKQASNGSEGELDTDMNKMMMSNKQKRLYERMKYKKKRRV